MVITRENIDFYLRDLQTPLGKIINISIVVLVMLSSGIFVVQTYPTSESISFVLNVADILIINIFAVEYLLRLWSAENRIQYIFSFYSIIDLIAILPFFMGIIDISYIRLLRWFRILRLIRYIDRKFLFGHITTEDGAIFTRILFILFAIIFVYSGLIYQVEHPVNPQVFTTFVDAIYFSIVTMTTVGFGDVTPVSQIGRLLTVLMILTGIALIPWQVGDLIKRIVKTANEVETICPGCGLDFHDEDAKFCKTCGTKLS
ncbi:Kef-type K+ ransport system, predicted NAD-binding component [Rivularia sp. PCC 7116]|uniref:ion transporter n=1 Tax=Rivularia sp. PCC 7116 TaxID=373994 RepID=UPI00029EC3DC|nr:ion transporter [Rivularia sp. PCC 7116]AFY55573.1 Kef-type K+ ransport system, predicted NAD-binding component [Rivularia sp. PCC 7116]